MTFHNNLILKDRRRSLRKRSTQAEQKLWFYLRNKKLKNTKFYRQFSIGLYILDFYCPKNRLGIEIDGEYHNEPEQKLYDQTRTQFLNENGISILRFSNTEVLQDIDTVLRKIVASYPPSCETRGG